MWPRGMFDPFTFVSSVPRRISLWNHLSHWPRDPIGFRFLGHLIEPLGKRIYGPLWTGLEPRVEKVAPLPESNTAGLPQDIHRFAVGLLRTHNQSYRDRADGIAWPGQSLNAFCLRPDPMPTDEEWTSVVPFSKILSAENDKSLERYFTVCGYIRFGFESGKIRCASRDLDGGPLRQIDTSLWNGDDLQHRFDTCRINYDRPYVAQQDVANSPWIFCNAEDFKAFMSGLRPLAETAAPASSVNAATSFDNVMACQQWLEEEIRASPEQRPHAKAYYATMARERFNVGTRKFDPCWKIAIRNIGAETWSKAGAPRGPRKSSTPKSSPETKS